MCLRRLIIQLQACLDTQPVAVLHSHSLLLTENHT